MSASGKGGRKEGRIGEMKVGWEGGRKQARRSDWKIEAGAKKEGKRWGKERGCFLVINTLTSPGSPTTQ